MLGICTSIHLMMSDSLQGCQMFQFNCKVARCSLVDIAHKVFLLHFRYQTKERVKRASLKKLSSTTSQALSGTYSQNFLSKLLYFPNLPNYILHIGAVVKLQNTLFGIFRPPLLPPSTEANPLPTLGCCIVYEVFFQHGNNNLIFKDFYFTKFFDGSFSKDATQI